MTIEHVLQSWLPLTTIRQSKQCNICHQLQEERENPEERNAFLDSAVEVAGRFEIEASKPRNDSRQGTICENVPVLDKDNVSAVCGSLAAGNGHTSISSSKSLCGPVLHTTTADESDSRLFSCTRFSKTTCHVSAVKLNGRW